MFGSWLWAWAHATLWRKSDRPPLREWIRAAKPWELALDSLVILSLVAALVIPWAATGSILASLATFVGVSLLVTLAGVVFIALASKNGVPAKGTYWDGKEFHYR